MVMGQLSMFRECGSETKLAALIPKELRARKNHSFTIRSIVLWNLYILKKHIRF